MTDKGAVSGAVRPVPQAEAEYRERENRARSERHQRAALDAAGLLQSAIVQGPAERPVWLRAVALLMEAIGADFATMTHIVADEGRRYRITRGRGLQERRSRLGAGRPPGDGADKSAIRVETELFQPPATGGATPGRPVAGAASSFHALLYPSGATQPLGCLSLYAGADLSLGADRVAFIHAVAALLSRELASAALPAPSLSGE